MNDREQYRSGIGTLVVRADASPTMGTGHVMRCLALAQAWMANGGATTFLISPGMPLVETRLRSEGIAVAVQPEVPGSPADASNLSLVAKSERAGWVVVDGYQFGAEYQESVAISGTKLLCFDDYGHAGRYTCDLVLNQNSYAHERYYQNRQIYTELLLGCEFTCLRREFWLARGRTKSIRADADRVLVTFGGSDADNRTLDVIRSTRVAGAASAEMIVVAGAGNPHLAALAAAAENTNDRVRIEANVTDMVALFAWTDIAVSGGGSTAWELAFMGVPTLLAVLADNQVLVAASLDERGIAINLGDAAAISGTDWAFQTNALLSDARRRQRMSEAGQQFVDGYGADRVVEKMLSQPKRPTR